MAKTPKANLDVPEDDAPKLEQTKRARQGTQHRPLCPKCSTDKKPVFLVAVGATQDGTHSWYACPNRAEGCDFPRQKVPRPSYLERLRRRRNRPDEDIGAR